MDLKGSNLATFKKNNRHLSEIVIIDILIQVLSAIEGIH